MTSSAGVTDIPARMAHRPRDSRGFPIPYAQFVGTDGVADFRVLDDERTKRCLRLRLCGLCGEQMGKHIFFVGGPLCVRNGLFHDPPMHRECAVFSLQACVHLNRSKGRYNLAAPLPQEPGTLITVGETMDASHKAEWFALLHTTAFTFGRARDGMVLIKATLPWLDVQRWRDGAPMEKEPTCQSTNPG